MQEMVLLPVTEPSQPGEVRRAVAALSARLGLGETERGRAAIVATELAGNLARHAERGMLLLQPVQQLGLVGVELLALDHGPGMENPQACLTDGFSTGGTPGSGLGAIRRQADYFDLYSQPGKGTAVVARIWKCDDEGLRPATPETPQGVVHIPKPGEEVCGDGWSVQCSDERMAVCVVDGLGHGVHAAEASREALRVFDRQWELGPTRVLEDAHAALRSTRGAAMAVAEIQPGAGQLRFAGVGNIAGSIIGGAGRHGLVSQNGTLGFQASRFQPFDYEWPQHALLVMHSDGVSANWDLGRYPGLTQRDPSLIAGILYRDFCRGRDDATVLVTRGAWR